MKLLGHLIGLFFVLGLVVVPPANADISLKLKQQQQQQQYLPPNESNGNEQQKFEESKYGNSKYQVFEVHNNFDTSAGQQQSSGGNSATNTNVNNAQSHSEEIRIEHINAPPGFPLDDPNLDATLLKVATEDNEISQQTTTTNTHENIPIPFPSNYRHEFPEKPKPKPTEYVEIQDPPSAAQYQGQEAFPPTEFLPPLDNGLASVQNQQYSFEGSFKAPDYLPPTNEGRNNEQSPFQGAGYLPPSTSSGPQAKPFKGSQYLPPITGSNGDDNTFKGPDYLPPRGNDNTNNPFKGPDYLPPYQSGSSQLSQSTTNSNNYFKGPDYLPPRSSSFTSGSLQSGQNNAFKGPDYLPPQETQHHHHSQQQNVGSQGFKSSSELPSGYDFQKPYNAEQAIAELHTLPEQTAGEIMVQSQDVTVHSHIQVAGAQKSSNIVYGTQKQGNVQQSSGSSYQAPGYLPPVSQSTTNHGQSHVITAQQVAGSQLNSAQPSGRSYQAPGYLPPVGQSHILSSQQNIAGSSVSHGQAGVSQVSGSSYQAPGYLPPTGHVTQQQQNGAVSASHVQSVGTQGSVHQGPTSAYQAPGYLPPIGQTQQQISVSSASQQQVVGVQQTSNIVYGSHHQGTVPQAPAVTYQASGYLPPSTTIQTQQQISGSSVYQAPGYLPPAQVTTGQVINQQTGQREGKAYSAPGYLPPGYDFQKPQEPQPQQGQNYQSSVQQTSSQSSSVATQSFVQQQQSFSHAQQNFAPQGFKAPGYLPPPSAPHIGTSSPFKGPGYLPPIGTVTNGQIQQSQTQSFQAPGYLPPASGPAVTSYSQTSSYRAPGYLPPAAAPQAAQTSLSYMHPLSSYMTSVQPYERYGSARKPFPEYGPPPASQSIVAPLPTNEVAPMYKEAASRPQHYAPAMSYSQNTVSTQSYSAYSQQQSYGTSALNQQARQALQTFMPKDIRQDVTPVRTNVANTGISGTSGISSSSSSSTKTVTKVSTPAAASAKIRTVQIVNPNTVKTLKVLESLDNAGVKTIKILGTSNEEPMGEHRVVKVVSGHEQNVQTVKIFNDQKDVTDSGSNTSSDTNNGYLSPRRKRNPRKTVAKGRKRILKN